jgi:hypothetical protein
LVRQKSIPLDSASEWREALAGLPHAFAHMWESCHAMRQTTGMATYLYCFEDGGLRIACPIAERTFEGYTDIVTPYGFSGFTGNGDYPRFKHYWDGFVRERGYVCGYIALNPLLENSTYFAADEAFQSNSLYFLDLTLSEQEMLARVDRNRRRQLKDWEKTFSNLIFDKAILTDFFLDNYYDFIERVKATEASRFSRETLSSLCSLDNVFMVGAGGPERVEAVYIFAYTPHVGDALFNVALPEGRSATVTLLWCGVNHLRSMKVRALNLGGGVREGDTIAQAKRRFGSRRLPFTSLKQVYRPDVYEKLCRQVRADPADRSGYFPAYRTPGSRNGAG